MNPTKNWGWTQVLWKDKQFLLHSFWRLKDNFPIFSHLHTRLKWTCFRFTASVNIVIHFTPYWWLWYNSNYVGCIVHKLMTSELQFLYIGMYRSYITYKWVTISLHWYLAFTHHLQVSYNFSTLVFSVHKLLTSEV